MKRRNLALLFPLILLALAVSAFAPGTIWEQALPTTSTATSDEPVTISPTFAAPVTVIADTPSAKPLAASTDEPLTEPQADPTVDLVTTVETEPHVDETAIAIDIITEPIAKPVEAPVTEPVETPTEVHVPILMYHYISPLPLDADSIRRGLTVEPHIFEAQLQYLRDNGYTTIMLADIYHALTVGQPLPEKPIVLTFDDGYVDAYTDALPLLQQYGFVGEFFVLATPAHYEAPAYMSWAQVQLLSDAGMSLQGHGRDHYDLRNRSYEFLVYQILGIKEAVEAHTERPVTFFCYPAGRYDTDTLAVVESAGYWGAVTTEWGATQRLDNRYTWPRIRVQGTWTPEHFATVLYGLVP